MDKAERSPYCQCLYFSANALARSMTRLAEEVFAPTGLRPSHAFVLMTVASNPGAHPGQIAEKMQLTASTVTRLVEALERRSLLVRVPGGREVNVILTKEGARLADVARTAWRQLYLRYVELLGEEPSKQLTAQVYAAHEILAGIHNGQKTTPKEKTEMSKKIGILGSGSVAQVLAAGFVKHGHPVTMGTRDRAKLTDFAAKHGGKIAVADFAGAAAFGEIVVLAVKGKVAKEALSLAGTQNLKGKVVIDPTNPIEDAPPENGVLKFFSNINRSLMEDLQAAFPEAKFVKAFSMIGGPHMVNPAFKETPTMFICGNDAAAKKEVSDILLKFGFVPEDMGAATAARAIEPLCILWCIPGMTGGGWNHALRLIRA